MFFKKKKIAAKKSTTVPAKVVETPEAQKKRMFVKLLGAAAFGLVGSLLVPRRADALVFGSTPASNVVGVKDSNNNRVNPATQESLATVVTNTGRIPANGQAAMAASLPVVLASDQSNVPITGTVSLATNTAVGVTNAANTRINPATQETLALLATEESTALLRRIVRQIDSLAVVDSAQRQKVTIDSITGSLTLATVTTVTTVSTVTSVTNLAGFGGVDPRFMLIDTARNAYANGIRAVL